MSKYKCSICGYVYDEALGDPDSGIKPGTKWEDIDDDWSCPLCGASKCDFVLMDDVVKASPKTFTSSSELLVNDDSDMCELSIYELGVLCSSMSKACSKQYLDEESNAFKELSRYFLKKGNYTKAEHIESLLPLINEDLNSGYPMCFQSAEIHKDRGALRVSTWGEKVTRMLASLMSRFEKQGVNLLEKTNVYVCEACGFVYVGDEAPEVCPVCKVPRDRINLIGRK
ncbi:MAG: rubredoxin [Candidatus Riflebacteria bacterium]|nr:rubredoxin [Candidatus Riflebacteria bacterium]